jgi:predicted extracellular nuclease
VSRRHRHPHAGEPGSEAELTNLWDLLPGKQHDSYIFQGNGQVLDHILASRTLMSPSPDFGAVHMNAEFLEEQQSDHDPPIARFRATGAMDG